MSIVGAMRQAEMHPGIPVVVCKLDRQPRIVAMHLEDWIELVRRAYRD